MKNIVRNFKKSREKLIEIISIKRLSKILRKSKVGIDKLSRNIKDLGEPINRPTFKLME